MTVDEIKFSHGSPVVPHTQSGRLARVGGLRHEVT